MEKILAECHVTFRRLFRQIDIWCEKLENEIGFRYEKNSERKLKTRRTVRVGINLRDGVEFGNFGSRVPEINPK